MPYGGIKWHNNAYYVTDDQGNIAQNSKTGKPISGTAGIRDYNKAVRQLGHMKRVEAEEKRKSGKSR